MWNSHFYLCVINACVSWWIKLVLMRLFVVVYVIKAVIKTCRQIKLPGNDCLWNSQTSKMQKLLWNCMLFRKIMSWTYISTPIRVSIQMIKLLCVCMQVCVCVCMCMFRCCCSCCPRREAGDVWCLPPVWHLRAVIWFHFAIASLVLLPSLVTLSVWSFSACWPFLLNFFQKILQYFFVKRGFFVWLLFSS